MISGDGSQVRRSERMMRRRDAIMSLKEAVGKMVLNQLNVVDAHVSTSDDSGLMVPQRIHVVDGARTFVVPGVMSWVDDFVVGE